MNIFSATGNQGQGINPVIELKWKEAIEEGYFELTDPDLI